MMNPSKNIMALFSVALTVFLFIFGVNILGNIKTQLNTTMTNTSILANYTNSTFYGTVNSAYDDTKSVFLDAVTVMLYIFMGLTIYSSFTQKNVITSYIFSFILSIITCVIIHYLFVIIYNQFITMLPAEYMVDLPTFFFENFEYLVIGNVIAGILSFVFVQRGVPDD